jgi:hypothetical protein
VQGAAACDTVKISPAIVSVPVRPVVAAFAATLKFTVPLPLPVAPLVTVIHGTAAVAVQEQPPIEVTAAEPEPPADAID